MKKYIQGSVIAFVSLLIFCVAGLIAFEWPQAAQPVESLFSKTRKGHFNNSIIFSNSSEVSVAEPGKYIMMLENDISDMGWFESPLGNSVIVAHKNNMTSIYSNLINVKVEPSKSNLVVGDVIGISGQSAWMEGNEGLSFQVIDTKMRTIINPVVLMNKPPQVGNAFVANVVAVNRNGVEFPMYNGALLSAGSYTLYMDIPVASMVHVSQVILNGEVKETINYDTLKQTGGTLVVFGNNEYSYDDIYPDENKMRLAGLLLSRGVNTIEIALSNVGDVQSSARFRITVE